MGVIHRNVLAACFVICNPIRYVIFRVRKIHETATEMFHDNIWIRFPKQCH